MATHLILSEYWHKIAIFASVIAKNMQEEIKEACRIMQTGGVILYPTDTMWALGCDATNEVAVKKIFDLKQRIDAADLLVLVDSAVKVDFYVTDMPDIAWDLIELSEKPLTIIYPNVRNLAPNIISKEGSLGIRVTKEDFSRRLCERFRKAIATFPATIGADPAPAHFSQIAPDLVGAVDFVVNHRRNDQFKPKSAGIISLNKGGLVKIIRE